MKLSEIKTPAMQTACKKWLSENSDWPEAASTGWKNISSNFAKTGKYVLTLGADFYCRAPDGMWTPPPFEVAVDAWGAVSITDYDFHKMNLDWITAADGINLRNGTTQNRYGSFLDNDSQFDRFDLERLMITDYVGGGAHNILAYCDKQYKFVFKLYGPDHQHEEIILVSDHFNEDSWIRFGTCGRIILKGKDVFELQDIMIDNGYGDLV